MVFSVLARLPISHLNMRWLLLSVIFFHSHIKYGHLAFSAHLPTCSAFWAQARKRNRGFWKGVGVEKGLYREKHFLSIPALCNSRRTVCDYKVMSIRANAGC